MAGIQVRYGDVLLLKRGILVHGCNARGAMGAGIAAVTKKRFPAAFKVYRKEYERTGLRLGGITFAEVEPELIIVNAVTQDDWRRPGAAVVLADYDAIEEAFVRVRSLAVDRRLSVHFPLIGCGLAGGNWGTSRRASNAPSATASKNSSGACPNRPRDDRLSLRSHNQLRPLIAEAQAFEKELTPDAACLSLRRRSHCGQACQPACAK